MLNRVASRGVAAVRRLPHPIDRFPAGVVNRWVTVRGRWRRATHRSWWSCGAQPGCLAWSRRGAQTPAPDPTSSERTSGLSTAGYCVAAEVSRNGAVAAVLADRWMKLISGESRCSCFARIESQVAAAQDGDILVEGLVVPCWRPGGTRSVLAGCWMLSATTDQICAERAGGITGQPRHGRGCGGAGRVSGAGPLRPDSYPAAEVKVEDAGADYRPDLCSGECRRYGLLGAGPVPWPCEDKMARW